jgi:hypothetical protein
MEHCCRVSSIIVVMDIIPGEWDSGCLWSLAAVVTGVPFARPRSALRTQVYQRRPRPSLMGSAEGDDIGNQVSVNSGEGGVGSKRRYLVTVGAGLLSGCDAQPLAVF